nr:receptor-like protein 43 [Populus alba]
MIDSLTASWISFSGNIYAKQFRSLVILNMIDDIIFHKLSSTLETLVFVQLKMVADPIMIFTSRLNYVTVVGSSYVVGLEWLTMGMISKKANAPGQVPSEITHLSKLVSLDLSDNNVLSLEPISFDKIVRNLTNLRELNLSGGKFPGNIFLLPNLKSLDLSYNEDLIGSFPSSNLKGKIPPSIINCTMLEVLDLGNNKIEDAFPYFLETLSKLQILILKSNKLQGFVKGPTAHNSFSKLQILDISYNHFSGPLPTGYFNSFEAMMHALWHCCSWDGITCDMKTGHVTGLDLACSMLYGTLHSNSTLFSLHHLQKLDLSDNHFNFSHISSRFGHFSNLTLLNLNNSVFAGQVPSEITHLSKLVSLDLSDNDFMSLEPSSLGNLTQLTSLDLSGNNFSGQIPSSLTQLTSLDLSGNNFSGQIPSSLRNLTQLTSLDLSGNNFSGQIPSSLGNLTQLTSLDLSGNNFSGQIPSSLGNLVQLQYLYLSFNKFTGQVPYSFGSLVNLSYLILSNNQLEGPIHSQLNTLSNLQYLILYGNLFNGTIPSFLFALPSLQYIDLHNNNFIGNISELQHDSLRFLDLSNNHLRGPIPSSIFKQEKLTTLILASNSNLIGEISSSICKMRFLRVLDLSTNSLSGSVPQCLGNFNSMLSVLHLGMNNLQGTIPSTFSKDNSLEYLNLNGNELKGKIPPSIINCTMLQVIDLGNNKIEDTFPNFLETLPELQILVLKSNKLQGFVKGPTAYNSFSKLRIFDISHNNFSGPLPTGYFNSLEAMMASDQNMIYMRAANYNGYVYSIEITWKGVEIEFTKIRSTIRVLDLSNNNFTGEIPKVIGKLKALQQLNLSHNYLAGHIQSSLGNLTSLESLDLSSNLLTGRIPTQLRGLTFLAILNLSHNQLEGPIPSGEQFNTFDASSFEGNLGLCGSQVLKKCYGDEAPSLPPSSFDEGDDSTLFGEGFGWKAVTVGYGCGFVFGVATGYVVFRTKKPSWFLRMVEDKWNLQSKKTKKNAGRYSARRN